MKLRFLACVILTSITAYCGESALFGVLLPYKTPGFDGVCSLATTDWGMIHGSGAGWPAKQADLDLVIGAYNTAKTVNLYFFEKDTSGERQLRNYKFPAAIPGSGISLEAAKSEIADAKITLIIPIDHDGGLNVSPSLIDAILLSIPNNISRLNKFRRGDNRFRSIELVKVRSSTNPEHNLESRSIVEIPSSQHISTSRVPRNSAPPKPSNAK